jgi:hypothetical protein
MKATISMVLAAATLIACGGPTDQDEPSTTEVVSTPLGTTGKARYVRFRVVNEDADARCTRRMSAVTAAVAKLEQRSVNLSAGATVVKDRVHKATVGSDSLLCFAPSGQVEYYDLARMTARAQKKGARPSEAQLGAAAARLVSELDARGLLLEKELDLSRVKWAEIETGSDQLGNPAASTSRTIAFRGGVPRVLAGVEVQGNGVSVQLDTELGLVALKVAWRDVEQEDANVPPALPAAEADNRFRAAAGLAPVANVRSGLGYLDAGLMQEQRYLEPWFLYVHDGGKRKKWGVPAVAAKESIRLTREVEPNVSRRKR